MKKALSLFLFLLLFAFANAQNQKKVLFLGNSYTGVNNLPNMVYRACASTGDTIIYDSYTPGGKQLKQHAVDSNTLTKIASRKWDFVALQAQSVEPALDSSFLRREVLPAAKVLCDSIRSNDSCSQPLFYMTWGRKNGYRSPDCLNYPWICTYLGMDSALRAGYTFMADTNNAEISPVGAVWRYIRSNYPTINLYSSDESHPSLAGSYAAACTFYTLILKKDPSQISWKASLSAAVADSIQLAAKRIAFDSLPKWNYSKHYPQAGFTYTQNAKQISFSDHSSDFDSLKWDFGDSSFSTQLNPIHQYANFGTYIVHLTAYKCSNTDSISDTIRIVSTGIQKTATPKSFRVFPNPVRNVLTIKYHGKQSSIDYAIYDQLGRLLMSQNDFFPAQEKIDVSALRKGIYYLCLGDEKNKPSYLRFVKQ